MKLFSRALRHRERIPRPSGRLKFPSTQLGVAGYTQPLRIIPSCPIYPLAQGAAGTTFVELRFLLRRHVLPVQRGSMKTMYSNIRGVLARAILAAAFLGASAVAHAQATTTFDLPAQPLADSLRAVASQTHSNILFDRSLVAGVSAKALAAQLSVDDALKRLLAGTGLTYRKADEKTVVIVPVSTSESSPGSVPPSSDGEGDRSAAGERREAGDWPGLARTGDASRKRGVSSNAIPISSGNPPD